MRYVTSYYFSLISMAGGARLRQLTSPIQSLWWCVEGKITSFQAPFHYCFSLKHGGSEAAW